MDQPTNGTSRHDENSIEFRHDKRSRRDRIRHRSQSQSRSRSRSRSHDRKSDRHRDRGGRKRHRRHDDNTSHRRGGIRKKDDRESFDIDNDNDDPPIASDHSQSSFDSSASSASSRNRHPSKKDDKKRHHRKETKRKHKRHHHRHRKKTSKKKKDKKSSKEKKRSRRDRSPSSDTSTQGNEHESERRGNPPAPPGAHELAASLTCLFQSYPAMSSLDEGGIPLLFIQLGRGTEFDLSQMPDRNLAKLLEGVFSALAVHGMERCGNGTGAWKWGNAVVTSGRRGGNGSGSDNLALLRLARALLDGVGVTMGAVQEYEQREELERRRAVLALQEEQQRQNDEELQQARKEKVNLTLGKGEEATQTHDGANMKHKKRVERMACQLLDRFDPRNSGEASSSGLANELEGICDILLEGESVQLDGIENDKLRATLAQLFQLVGLELVEMDDDEEDEDENGIVDADEGDKNGTKEGAEANAVKSKEMGYALPEDSDVRNTVTSYLNEVLRVCRFRTSDGKEGAPTSWAANPTTTTVNGQQQAEMESSSDEDDGPAPLGTMAAVKASKRQRPPKLRDPNNPLSASGHEEGGREEWMLVPGEHDFLKGIQAGGSKSFRGRTFKNEKNRGLPIASSSNPKKDEPIDPNVLAEVNAIQQAYEESRGPSLLDAHRQQQQQLKEQEQGQKKKEWKWSRDKNLDDGRRVDKNALHMVLGGASTELKNKFQGGVGR